MLPKGYLDFTAEQYSALTLEVQREVYRSIRDIIRHTIGTDTTGNVIRNAWLDAPPPRILGAGTRWIIAAKFILVKCERCRSTGEYAWGACVNGKMTHTGSCFRCNGKGYMNFNDMRRCKAYDNTVNGRAW